VGCIADCGLRIACSAREERLSVLWEVGHSKVLWVDLHVLDLVGNQVMEWATTCI
jgi:hypothetical protein